MTRDELLAAIKTDRAKLEAVVTPLSDAELTTPGHEGWSVKDHLSHVAAWERMIVAHLTDGSDPAVVAMSPAQYAAATLQQINDRLYELRRDDSLEEARAEFAFAHAAIVDLIEELPEERSVERYWEDGPERTVLEKIAGDSYLHYQEHAGWIRGILARTAEAR